MKLMKVYDVVSDNIPNRGDIMDRYDWLGQNSYIKFDVTEPGEQESEEDEGLNSWLLENGANPDEEVLVLIWW